MTEPPPPEPKTAERPLSKKDACDSVCRECFPCFVYCFRSRFGLLYFTIHSQRLSFIVITLLPPTRLSSRLSSCTCSSGRRRSIFCAPAFLCTLCFCCRKPILMLDCRAISRGWTSETLSKLMLLRLATSSDFHTLRAGINRPETDIHRRCIHPRTL